MVKNWNGLWQVKQATLLWFIGRREDPITFVICWNSIPPPWQFHLKGGALSNNGQMPDKFQLNRPNADWTCFFQRNMFDVCLPIGACSWVQHFQMNKSCKLLPAVFQCRWFGMFWPCKPHDSSHNRNICHETCQKKYFWFVDPVKSKTTLIECQLFDGIVVLHDIAICCIKTIHVAYIKVCGAHTHADKHTDTQTHFFHIANGILKLRIPWWGLQTVQNSVGLQLDNGKNATIVSFWFLECCMETTMSVSRPAIAPVLAYLAVCVTARCDFRRIHAVPWNSCITCADFKCTLTMCADYHNLCCIYVLVLYNFFIYI